MGSKEIGTRRRIVSVIRHFRPILKVYCYVHAFAFMTADRRSTSKPATLLNQFESMLGSQETLRNFERESCKTVFLGSQDFELRTNGNVLLTASIRPLGHRYPQHSQVLGDWRVSPVSRQKPARSQVNVSRGALLARFSPFSLVDRSRLLTRGLSLGYQTILFELRGAPIMEGGGSRRKKSGWRRR